MQNRLRSFALAMGAIISALYHYTAPDRKPAAYGVWMEEGQEALVADNQQAEQTWIGSLEYFTKEEFDETLDDIPAAFEQLGAQYRLDAVQYEDETGFIHYSWSWSWA